MTPRLHDTLSRRLAEIEPIEPGHVRMYTCGPTVWNRAHIGNFRTFLFEDVLRRWLERRFPRVTHVMNLTDVDDRLIDQAGKHSQSLDEETAPWIVAFFEDLETLGIRRAHHYPRATEYVDQMVDLIERLEAAGATYRSEDSIYFSIGAFPRYGALSGVSAEGLVAGASGRVDADDYTKEDARDFALWKGVGPDEIGWDTRLGRGRPGWHIECSAMAMTLLGESFDVHCGGVDNIFPHHENEIAQSEAATHQQFVRLWAHAAHLQIGGEKMAKRLGNFKFVPDLVRAGARPAVIRYFLITGAHYRKQLNWDEDAFFAAEAAVGRLVEFRDRLDAVATGADAPDAVVAIADGAWERFSAALDDDLNVPEGVGAVFAALRDVNRELDRGPVSAPALARLRTFVADVDDVLGILPLVDRDAGAGLEPELQAMLDERAAARAAKDFAASDRLRDALAEKGIVVEDTSQGQRWKRR
jgi:cysteinyl-tRNA synthetase